MPAPFLRLLLTPSWGPKNLKVVLAASGPALFCFNFADGSLLSRWSHLSPTVRSEPVDDSDGAERPSKRRRLSADGEEEDGSDAQSPIVVVNDANAQKPRRKKKKAPPLPSVIKLTASSDGRHVVVVTGEDKTIRVLEMLDGQLSQISERAMPKKPGAVTLTPDQSTIVAGDKFGDVYALPLTFTEKENLTDESPAASVEPEMKAYKPAATNLTVHTRKNLHALEQQLNSKNLTVSKKSYDFEHRLILGHVSLLTDLIALTHIVDGKTRSYILTADRDEHIRITRGIPQTHVIEGFCLGHANFVNKLLVPATHPELLISGGGDDYLLLWDWVHGKLLSRVSLLEHVNAVRLSGLSLTSNKDEKRKGSEESKIAVSGIWSLRPKEDKQGHGFTQILVTCEAVPAVIVFQLDDSRLRHLQTLELAGNPLDVVMEDQGGTFMVSVDNVHRAGSTSEVHRSEDRPFVYSFERSPDSTWQPGGPLDGLEENLNVWAKTYPGKEAEVDEAAVGTLLYGAEHLRKRVGAEADADAEGEGEVDEEL